MSDDNYKRRDLFEKLFEYKYIIVFTTLLFLFMALLYLSKADKVYRSDATIEILPKNNPLSSVKINLSQNSSYERYFQTQMEFLKSRYMVEKVVEKLNYNVRFYKKGILNSYKILDRRPAITVKEFNLKDDTFYNRFFKIKILNSKQYSISLVTLKLFKNKISEPLVCEFGKKISTKYMEFTITKDDIVGDNEYFLNVVPKYVAVENSISKLDITRRSDKSSLMSISYEGNSPYKTKVFLDELIGLYISILNKTQNSEIKNYETIVNEELAKLKAKLDENEKKLLKFSETNQVSGMKIQTDNLVNSIYKNEEKLSSLDQEYENMRNILIMIKRGRNYNELLTLLSQVENKNLEYLLKSIIEDEKKYESLKEKYKDLYPEMVELKNQISSKKVLLKRNLIALYKNIKLKRDDLKNTISQQKYTLTNLPTKEMGLSKLQREQKQLEQIYIGLQNQKSKLNLSTKINQDYMIKVVDKPYIPTMHIKPKGAVILFLSVLSGMMTGMFFALIKSYFKRKIIVPDDIKEITQLPLISTIPKIKDHYISNELFVLKDPDCTASKMIWQIKNSIDRYKNPKKCLLIGVTSMIRGEGKTTIAANIATVLAESDQKVIVLSMDFRLPLIHTVFGVDNRFGLSNVMYEDLNINNVIKKVKGIENLYLLPAGTAIKNPIKIVNSKFMDKLLKELKKVFDYVVIDMAPVSVAVESTFMMKQVDLNLFVFKSNYSEKEFIKDIEEISKTNNIKNLVYILNAVNPKYIKVISHKENKKYIEQNSILNTNY